MIWCWWGFKVRRCQNSSHQTSITCSFFATCQGNHISTIRNLILFCTQLEVMTPHKSSHSLAESFIDILFYCQTRALSGFLPSLRSNLSTCLNAVKSERLEYSGPSNYFCDVWLQSHRAAGYKGNSAKWHAGKNSLEGFKVQFLKNDFQLNSFKVIRVWGDVFDRLKNMLLLLHDNL